PAGLRTALVDLIGGQARPGGAIAIKVNHLVDRGIIAELCAASQAGAEVDLVVRGTCCLRPGIRGRSEGVRVRSIIGRYLEHSRIFRFGRGPDARHLIGSADLMPRNLDERIEALAPVVDPALRARLDEILELALADDVLAWDLRPDGTWRRPAGTRGHDLQEALATAAREPEEPGSRAAGKFIPTAR
ncbi:MAG TPA: RNA degradosome polyphosphate kinase, partial [Actinomycetota bacterium]|nr:RNA degradosome polyphosphate kinase [Actinomycetota bacterium]